MQTLSHTDRDVGWTTRGFVTRATLRDARELAERLRPEDVRELADTSGKTPREALAGFVLYGEPCVSLWSREGDLVGMAAAVPFGPSLASVGMVGTPAIASRPLTFLRASREALDNLHRRYDGLVCTADARNSVHLNWLDWLGFTALRRVEGYGRGGIAAVEYASIRTRDENV